jgi:integrase
MAKHSPTLTTTAIKNAKPKSKRYCMFDGKVTGFHLVILPSGTKSFWFKYEFEGKVINKSVGQFPDFDLEEARQIAQDWKRDARQGTNPAAPIIAIKGITLGEVSKQLIELQSKRKSNDRILKIQQALNKHVLPKWGNIEINKITNKDVINLLKEVEESGTYIVQCVHRYLTWIFDLAFANGDITAMPIASGSLMHVSRHKETNMRAMDFARLPDFLEDLRFYRCQRITELAIQFILHNAIRTAELRKLKWSWYNEQNAQIVIPAEAHKTGKKLLNDGKKGSDFYILLSRQSINILERAKVISGEYELIFPSPMNLKAQASDAIINKALDRMGWIDEHSGHGFRALFRTTMRIKANADKDMLELCLNHETARSALEKDYERGMHLAFHAERRQIMQQWSDLIDSVKKV